MLTSDQTSTPDKTTKDNQPKPVDEKQIVDTLFKEVENYRQATQTQRQEINDIYSAYIGNMDAVKKVPYFEPITIPKLRTEISYIVPYIFSGNPELEVEGVGEEDKPIAGLLEKIVNFRLQTIPQAYEKIESWVKQSVTFGTSILRVNWKFETETVDEKQDPTQYQTPTKDEPVFDVPNILDCFYSPILPDTYCQNSMIFRSVLPISEIKENAMYDYTGLLGLNRDRVEGKSSTVNTFDSSQQIASDAMDIKRASEGTVEVYERVTQDRIQTVVDGKERLVIRDKPLEYGFINAVKLTHEPNCIPNRFDGFGVGHNTMGLSKGYHSIVNQIKQNVALSNNTHFITKKGTNIKKQDLVVKPGGMTEVDCQGPLREAFMPMEIPDIKQGALEFMNLLDDQHKRASGANDIVQGGASNQTLGQDQLATANSSNRFELIQRRFKQALADLANMLIKLELQNLQSPDAEILRIFPDEMPQQVPDPMTGQMVQQMVPGFRKQIYEILVNEAQDIKFNIKVKGDTTISKNKDVQIKQLIDWYNLFGPSLPPKNQMEAAKKILELRGIDGIDTLVPSEQEMQMQQQQAQQAINQQAMQGQPTQQGINQQTYQQ